MMISLLALLCIVVTVAALFDCSDPSSRGCSGHGECDRHHGAAMPFCICSPGYRGISCFLPPQLLPRAWGVPGMVRTLVPQHYRLDEWHVGDALELDWLVEQSEEDSDLPTLLLAVNRVPNETDTGADVSRSTPLTERMAFIKLTEPKRRDSDRLFITVVGNSEREARFDIILDRGGERQVLPISYPDSFVRNTIGFVSLVVVAFVVFSLRKRRADGADSKRTF
jgi:hypothetical protein